MMNPEFEKDPDGAPISAAAAAQADSHADSDLSDLSDLPAVGYAAEEQDPEPMTSTQTVGKIMRGTISIVKKDLAVEKTLSAYNQAMYGLFKSGYSKRHGKTRCEYYLLLTKASEDDQTASMVVPPITIQLPFGANCFSQYGSALLRHLLLRHPELQGKWDELHVFQNAEFDVAQSLLEDEKTDYAMDDNAAAVLAQFKQRHTLLLQGTRDNLLGDIKASLTNELNNVAQRGHAVCRTHVIINAVVLAGAGAPAGYLMYQLIMGTASNVPGAIAGAVILGLIAVLSAATIATTAKPLHALGQAKAGKNLQRHLGPHLFAIKEGEPMPGPAAPVAATVVN